MDGEAWWAAVHGVAQSQTRLSDFTFTFHVHALETEMATHSSVLAWRIPGGFPSMGSHRVGHNWSDLAAVAAATSKCRTVSIPQIFIVQKWLWNCQASVCSSVFVSSQQRFGVTDIKAPSTCHSSRVLDKTTVGKTAIFHKVYVIISISQDKNSVF